LFHFLFKRSLGEKQGFTFEEDLLLHHSNSEDLNKTRKKTVGSSLERSSSIFRKKKEPKIIITPAKEESEIKKSISDVPEIKSISEVGSNTQIDQQKAKSHVPGIFRKKSKKNPTMKTAAHIRHRQSLTRPTPLKTVKVETGRLLSIIAKQALFGKQSEASKAFLTALVNSPNNINIKICHRKRSMLKLLKKQNKSI